MAEPVGKAQEPTAKALETGAKSAEHGNDHGLRAEVKKLKEGLSAAKQTPPATPLNQLTKEEIETFRKVMASIRGALGIETHPVLRRRAVGRLALIKQLVAEADDEDELDDEDIDDEDIDAEEALLARIGGGGKLALARSTARRRAVRRLALIRYLANQSEEDDEDEDEDEEGLGSVGKLLVARGVRRRRSARNAAVVRMLIGDD